MDIPIIIENDNTKITTNITESPIQENNNNNGKSIYAVFHTIISILAVYLSFRCNQNINYISILIALFFPYIYIIYSVIMHNGICKI